MPQTNITRITFNHEMIAVALRKKAITQSELARRVGIDKAAVYRWIKGKSQPCLENLRAMCLILDTPMEDFFIFSEKEVDRASTSGVVSRPSTKRPTSGLEPSRSVK